MKLPSSLSSNDGTHAPPKKHRSRAHTNSGRRRAGRKKTPADAQLAEAVRQKNLYLRQIAAKITGNSESEVPPLVCSSQAPGRAVFLVTTPIAFGRVEVSRKTYELLAKHVGMSMNSISHWAVVVVDRGLGPTYVYDLMSDQLKVQMLMNNYFRVYEATPEFIAIWSSCYYVRSYQGDCTKDWY